MVKKKTSCRRRRPRRKPVVSSTIGDQGHLSECLITGIRKCLQDGMEPQALADRLGQVIDAIVGDLKDKNTLGL